MPITISKLVQAKVLQDYLVDKSTGEALTAGVITCYKDNARTQLKNWYYQSGTYPNYTYIALPNPLTLSAAGTIVDDDGNDVLPFFYPYQESNDTQVEYYYIDVRNSLGQQQFTRQKFPFLADAEQPSTGDVPQLKNLIVNSRFWRGAGTQDSNGTFSLDLSSETNVAVLPSQHDGFSQPDIRFLKSGVSNTDQFNLKKFEAGDAVFDTSIRPEYYIEHICSSSGGSLTYKTYQFPISLHIATLDGVSAVFSIWAKKNSSTGSNKITPKILQYMGSGSGNSSPDLAEIMTIEPTSEWKQYHKTFTFQSTTGKNYDKGEIEDSAFYLALDLEVNNSQDVSFAIPSIFLGSTLPTTDFSSYDDIDTIINSSRTGDIKITSSLFGTQPNFNFGWIPLDDKTIGNSSSGSTGRKGPDTWPLFKLIWENYTNTTAPIYTSVGAASTRGSDAKSDFEASKRLSLPLTAGRALGAVGAGSGLTARTLGETVGSETHAMIEAELAPHTHTYEHVGLGGPVFFTAGGSGDKNLLTYTSGSTGSGTPFNIMQPTVFYNMLIKL